MAVRRHVELHQIARIKMHRGIAAFLPVEGKIAVILTPDHCLMLLNIAPQNYSKHI